MLLLVLLLQLPGLAMLTIFICDIVHLYAQRKLIFVQKLLQAPSDVIRTCAYMYTVSRENAFLREIFDAYIGNSGGNMPNVKGTIANVVSNKFRDLCNVKQ